MLFLFIKECVSHYTDAVFLINGLILFFGGWRERVKKAVNKILFPSTENVTVFAFRCGRIDLAPGAEAFGCRHDRERKRSVAGTIEVQKMVSSRRHERGAEVFSRRHERGAEAFGCRHDKGAK